MSGESFDNRNGKIWYNGKMVEWRDANLHLLSHGLHYGSSVFEGARAYNQNIFKLDSVLFVNFIFPFLNLKKCVFKPGPEKASFFGFFLFS